MRSAEGGVPVRNVGLCSKQQECLGIVGESGSGKTITVKAILHLLSQDLAASVVYLRISGEDLSDLPEKERRIFLGKKVGFISQNTVACLHPLIRIKDQLTDRHRIHLQTSKKTVQERAKTLLDWVGIRDANRVMESYPAQISGEIRQRVNVVMALMCEPQIIVANEPTTTLNCVVKQQVIELFHSISEQQHVAIIMVSRDLNPIQRYCDKMAVMYAGQIVGSDGSNEVFSQPQHFYTQALPSVIPRLDQNRDTRLNEILDHVPEHGRDTSHRLFQPRYSACRQECGGSVKSSRRGGHFARCSKVWKECRA